MRDMLVEGNGLCSLNAFKGSRIQVNWDFLSVYTDLYSHLHPFSISVTGCELSSQDNLTSFALSGLNKLLLLRSSSSSSFSGRTTPNCSPLLLNCQSTMA